MDKQRQNRISADAKRMGADEPRWVGTGQMGMKRIVGTWNGLRGPGMDCGDVKRIEGMWNGSWGCQMGCGDLEWFVGGWNGVERIVGVWNGL